MNDQTLQELIRDSNAFFAAFRKDDSIINFLKGKFTPGKVPYMHTVHLEDGSKVCVKFVDTIKYLLDSKLQRRPDRDSHLCYYEVSVYPLGMKAYTKVFDAKAVPSQPPKDVALVKHQKNLAKVKELAEKLEIDLSVPGAWCTMYSENYNK